MRPAGSWPKYELDGPNFGPEPPDTGRNETKRNGSTDHHPQGRQPNHRRTRASSFTYKGQAWDLARAGAHLIQEIGFALDSALGGDGFEPSVPAKFLAAPVDPPTLHLAI
jgi:hypothetical protein